MADIKHTITISAPEERIRSLVSSAAGFSEWWALDSAQKGDLAELGFYSKNTVYKLRLASSPDGIVWQCESGEEWNGTTLRFQWNTNGKSCTLQFEHSNWKKETPYFTICNTTWGELMFRLKAAAEGKKPGPLFTKDGMAA